MHSFPPAHLRLEHGIGTECLVQLLDFRVQSHITQRSHERVNITRSTRVRELGRRRRKCKKNEKEDREKEDSESISHKQRRESRDESEQRTHQLQYDAMALLAHLAGNLPHLSIQL